MCESLPSYRVSFVLILCQCCAGVVMRGGISGVRAANIPFQGARSAAAPASEARRATSCQIRKERRDPPPHPCSGFKRCGAASPALHLGARPGPWGPPQYGPGQPRTSRISALAGRWQAGLAALRLCRGAVQIWGSFGWARTSRSRPAERMHRGSRKRTRFWAARPLVAHPTGRREFRLPGRKNAAHFCGRLQNRDAPKSGRYNVTVRW